MNTDIIQIQDELDKFTGPDDISLSSAMRKIDANGCGILFLIDSENKLTASLSDGDIRRFLLNGGDLNAPALNAANLKPKTALTVTEAQERYNNRGNLLVIPLINSSGTITGIYNKTGRRPRERQALNIPVVINAGGKGTRLDPFTRVLPKPLIPVGEFPIIELIMKEFMTYNCNEFNIIINYKRELLKAYFSENENKTCYNINWINEYKSLGTGGGISLLRDKIDSTFFFSSCDSLLTADYSKIINFHRENNNLITMICAYKNMAVPYGIVEMGVQGKILGMKEKPLMSFLINTGIYIVEPEIIYDIPDDTPLDFPDIIESERQKGHKVAAFPISETEWLDMGQLPELEKMRRRLYGE